MRPDVAERTMSRAAAFRAMSRWLRRLFGGAAPAIRRAGPKDAPALAQLHGASFHRGWSEQEFTQILIERNALAHLARLKRDVVGFIVSRAAGDEAEILSVAVAGQARGAGVGRALLDRHLSELAGLGIGTVFLEVEENNLAARRLYRRAGFSDVGQREGYYRSGPDNAARAIIMRRDLD